MDSTSRAPPHTLSSLRRESLRRVSDAARSIRAVGVAGPAGAVASVGGATVGLLLAVALAVSFTAGVTTVFDPALAAVVGTAVPAPGPVAAAASARITVSAASTAVDASVAALAAVDSGRPVGPPGFGVVCLVGAAARDDRAAAIERLTAKVERAADGAAVDFSSDRDDDLGALSRAVGELAAAARAGETDGDDEETGAATDVTAGEGAGESEDDATAGDPREPEPVPWRRLHEIATDPDLDDDARVERLLDLGRDRLGVDWGAVVRFDGGIDDRALAAVADPSVTDGDDPVLTDVVGTDPDASGDVAEPSSPLHRRTVERDAPLALADVAELGADGSEADRLRGIGSYLGTTLRVDDDQRGTLCFADADPRAAPFTDADVAFAEHLARTVAHALGRRDERATLAGAESLLDSLFEALPANIYVKDREGRSVRMNARFFAESGQRDAGDILGKTDREVFPEDVGRETYADDMRVVEDGDRVEDKLERHSGEWFRTSKVPWRGPDGEIRGLVGITREITAQRERERQLTALVQNTSNAIFIKDRDGVYEFVNEAAAEVWGLAPGDVVGRTDAELFDDESVREMREGDETVLAEAAAITRETTVTVDGERRVFLDEKYPYRDEDGTVVGVMGIGTDITERKETERELERQATMLDSLFEQIPVSLYVKDREGRHVRSSTPYIREEYPDDEEWIKGKTDREVFPEGLAGETYADDMRVVEDGESILEKEEYDPEDDEWLLTSKVPWRDDDGEIRGLIGISQYITDQKERQRELRETRDRLAANNETLQRLYEISADPDADFEETVQRVLDLGRERLEAEAGFLARTDRGADQFEVVHASGSDDRLEAGAVAPLSETYCRKTIDTDGLLSVVDAGSAGWDGDVAYERWDYDCYVGGKVFVGDDLYGTLCFVDSSARDGPFTEEERTFVELASQWLGYELERQQRERRLERYREYTDDVLDAIDDVFYVLDSDGKIRRWNDSLRDAIGASDEEIAAMDRTDFFGESDAERVDDAIDRVFETGNARIEADLRTSDGGDVPYEFDASLLEDPDGEPVVAGIGRDVSERKERERALRETNERLGAVIESSPDAVIALDPDGRVTLWNPAAERLFGWTADEVLGEPMPIVPDGLTAEFDEFRDRLVDGDPVSGVETVRRTKSGALLDVNVSAAPMRDEAGEVVGIMGVLEDISERKERERELERTSDMLAKSQRLATVGAWELDVRDGRPTALTWTDEVYRIHDLPVESDVTVDEAIEYYHPDDGVEVREAVERAIRERRPYDLEARLVTAEGRDRWVRSIGDPVERDGEVVGIRGSIQDVTERTDRERQLRRTKDRLQKFIETSPVGVLATDPDGVVTLWNDAMADIFGWSETEVLGEPYPAVPDDVDDEESVRERVLAGESFAQVELERETRDGERIDVTLSTTPIYDDAGDVTEVVAYIQDITERKERERELRRTRDMLAQAGRIADVGGFEVDLRTDPPTRTWSDQLYDIHGLARGAELDLETILECYHVDDRDRIRRMFDRAIERGEPYDIEVRLRTDGERPRWVRALCEPVREAGDVVSLRGSVQDVTARKERELALESLHETTRGLLRTETAAEAAELVVEAAGEVLDVAGVAVYRLDVGSNRLEPAAQSPGFADASDDAPAVGPGDGDALWTSFVTGTPMVFDDTEAVDGSRVFGPAVGGGLLVPIGDHGVFAVATATETVDDDTRRLVETLVATTAAAFDRLQSEADLRERDAELEARNARLRRQMQITDIIRQIDRSLIEASSREAVEAAVCGRLVEAEDVAFAWIGGLGPNGAELEPRAMAGDGGAYLDSVSLSLADDATEPAVRTAATEEPTVVGNVVDRLQTESWRKPALASEFHSVVSVPLAYEEYFYGVLTVYAGKPDGFGDLERSVFAELGTNIGNSITAIETRRALHADTLVELTLRFDADETFLGRLARDAGCAVAFESLAEHAGDEVGLFVSTTGASADAVSAVLDDIVAVTDYRLVSGGSDDGGAGGDDGDGGTGDGGTSDGGTSDGGTGADAVELRFELTVAGDVLPSRLVRHGGNPRSITATASDAEVVVDVPTSTDVREFVEMLGETAPGVELVGRRTVERATQTRQELASDLFGALTDRQLEVMRTAYFAGFFEWPRESTGEDVAAMLDVTQPTVNRHLRLAQRRLLERLFEDADATAVAD